MNVSNISQQTVQPTTLQASTPMICFPNQQSGIPATLIQGDAKSLVSTLAFLVQQVNELTKFAGSASATASLQRGDGRSTFTKASEFGDLAQVLFQQFAGNQNPDAGMIIDSFGQTAQAYLQNSLKASLVGEAATYFGFEAGSLTANDFLSAGLDWVASGFDSTAFTSSLGTASTANTAALGGETAAEGFGSAFGGATAGKILGGVGAAYSAYSLFKNWGKGDIAGGAINGAATGAYIGSVVPGVGTAIGAVVGGLLGAASGLFKTGKHKDQVARDGVREALINNGLLTNDYKLTLANGSNYDIGKDGGFKLINVDGTTRHAYDVDFQNPLAAQTVGMAQSFVSVMLGGDKKLSSDFTGYVVNAALSNASTIDEARANLLSIFKQFKLAPEGVLQGISSMIQSGVVTQDVGLAYANGLRDLFAEETAAAA